ncbi:MAG: hypothetical protein KDC52_14370, partial [Ignavibacteriae bacterium]|nr:hypothetical protein [Ignavibacteriota bacterium]
QQKLKTTLSDDLIVELMRIMPLNNPAPLINSFNIKVKDYIEKFPGERIIANLNELDYNIRKSGFETIASKEIILRSVFNKAQQRLNNIADEANERIQIASSTVMELNEIADYNFETALSILETESITSEEKKKIEKDGLKVALEGINRIRERSKELISELKSLNEKTFGDFQIVINDFSSNLFKLNNTEELSKQRINLAKQKAKEEFNEQVSNVKTGITNVIPIVISKSKSLYHLILTKVFKLSESIGLSSKAKEATEEILDYIVETEKQISKLPIVYQRLFKNQPVEEDRFFIGRKQELQVINKAFLNWNKNKFAPVVIVSEKGAGASSLTNMAKKQIERTYQVIHVKLSINIYQPDIFLQLISEKLNLEPIANFEELIKTINSLASKKVIIMENIEALFLRTVNGFEVLKMFFQMLSLTNKKIFWIATCNKYAWDYLDKVLSIEDYFAYHVEFEKFSDTEIKDIIMKRHNMSGYKLNFLPSKADLENKQFKKLNEEQKKNFLRNEFFEELNEISQSNVGLAQLFWLRSITSLSNNQINISSLSNIDFSFLKSISKAKVFSLYALLIHDGLTIEQHAKVFNISTDESKLLLYTMHDDGEIVLKDNIYRVNFLLYVHTIKLLKVQ